MLSTREGRIVGLIALLWSAAVSASADDGAGLQGVLAVRGTRVLAAENPDRAFTPASVQKLVVSAAALHHLGPDYRFVTRLRTAAERDGDTLKGDLILDAGGDPTWSERFHEKDARAPLRQLARALKKRGVRTVEGGLLVDLSRFPGRPMPVDWPVGDVAFSYGSPTSGIAVDENLLWVSMAPGGYIGASGRINGPDGVEITNRTRTVSKARHGRGTVDFQPVWGEPRLVVRGEYPISEGAFNLKVASPDPEQRAAREIQRVFEQEGITFAQGPSLTRDPVAKSTVLATVTSATVAEIVDPILTESNNWLAEMLLRLVSLELAGEGRLDTGLDLMEDFLEETVGVPRDSFMLDDASGLSPFNLLTPNAVVRLLQFVWEQPWRETFQSSLSTGSSGTLSRGWPRLPPVAAKTGTLRATQTLAGVLDPTAKEPIFFVVLLNHRQDARFGLRTQIANELWRWYRGR
ncbi:MAG: D-alanyl-D-alanine carboxypeptidase/D-alanyl-D-alanine-endopeptidase [Acidobacteriota bacterium]